MHRVRMPTSLAILVGLLYLAPQADGESLERASEVVEIFSALPTGFVLEGGEETDHSRIVRLRSANPIEHSAAGPVYQRATVTISTLANAAAASAQLSHTLASAHPDTGISYAWDFVRTLDRRVVRLHAECTFSEESFLKVARALADIDPDAQEMFSCRCGSGCRPGSPWNRD